VPALYYTKKAFKIREGLVTRKPKHPVLRKNLATTGKNLGVLHRKQGDAKRAKHYTQKAKKILAEKP
jgi:hypothetical protein